MTQKAVRFAPFIHTTMMIDRPSADEILDCYYQEEDYKSFRRKEFIRELRERNANKISQTRRRHDSLSPIMMNPFREPSNEDDDVSTAKGLARAA